MVSRILAGAAALVAIGSFAAPVAVSAKGASGGAFGGHASLGHASPAFHSGMHPGLHPGLQPHGPFPAHAPFFAHGPFLGHFGAHGIGFRRFALRPDRFPGTGWWWTGFDEIGPYAYYYPPYTQPGSAAPGDQSAPPPPAAADGTPQTRPAMIYRPGCRTQTQTVPSEFAGTRTVNITRCY